MPRLRNPPASQALPGSKGRIAGPRRKVEGFATTILEQAEALLWMLALSAKPPLT
jgi:hypothetical protein